MRTQDMHWMIAATLGSLAASALGAPPVLRERATVQTQREPALYVTVSDAVPEGHGWLGIMLGPVPKVLQAHLAWDGPALLVQNVAKDSPADAAGIRQFDVIVKLDGQPMPHEPSDFVSKLQGKHVGDQVSLMILRAAKTHQIVLTLAKAPSPDDVRYKFETSPDVQYRDQLDLRAKVLRRGPNGELYYEDLGALPGAKQYFEWLARPPMDGRRPLFWMYRPAEPGDHSNQAYRFSGRWVRQNGTIEIDVDGHGAITVRRTRDEDGKSVQTSVTYETEASLKDRDPEAFELYETMRKGVPAEARDKTRDQRLDEWMKALEEQLEQYKLKGFTENHPAMRALRERERALRGQEDVEPTEPAPAESSAQAATSFAVDVNGRITVTVRKGDTEMSVQFENEEALKSKAPDLYQRFEAMRREHIR